MNLSKQRIKELERAEAKLRALEAGGVDGWEGYDSSLEEYRAENEREEKLDELLGELEQIFGECAYEPSERGVGIAFTDDVVEQAMAIFNTFGVYFKEDK